MDPHVRVGVGVFVLNSAGLFIMGKRKGSHGAGKPTVTFRHVALLHENYDLERRVF